MQPQNYSGPKIFNFSFAEFIRPYSLDENYKFAKKDNACVVLDGSRVIFASEMERHTKLKHDYKAPTFALDAFKKYSGLPWANHVRDFTLDINPKQHNHHNNHIYECFYQSGFSQAAVLVNDCFGNNNDAITLAYMKEGEAPVILKKFPSSASPCHAYCAASIHAFGNNFSEGKLMGLAAYGKNNGKQYIRWNSSSKSIETDEQLLLNDIKTSQNAHDKQATLAQIFDVVPESSKQRHAMITRDVAYTIQKNFEDTLVEVAKHLKELLEGRGIQTSNLCMSGGGILNCPTNSRIINLGLFKHYYASPQPGDGCAQSIGRALWNLETSGEKLKSTKLKTAYLGVTYPASKLPFPRTHLKHPISQLCSYLQNGNVLAWFQDGAEYGPRALGHRSFLADPSKPNMLTKLNTLKGREQWRPLAPIVPDRLFNLLFDVSNTDMCEFMLRTLHIREKWQSMLQAVCHVDGTTRPQLLKRETNPELYDILITYYEQTGVPCLVNTSLNINGFPIVESPCDVCDLSEEIACMQTSVPQVNTIFIEHGKFYEVHQKPVQKR